MVTNAPQAVIPFEQYEGLKFDRQTLFMIEEKLQCYSRSTIMDKLEKLLEEI